MKVFSTISRVLVVAAVVFAGNATACQPKDLKGGFNHHGKQGARLLINNKHALMSTFASSHVKGDLNKAGVETIGFMLDRAANTKNGNVEPTDLLIHLGVNYGVRKGGQQLEKMGITVDAAAKKCDVLPEGMVKDIVNPAVRTVVETATEPEILTLLAMNYVLPVILNMVKSN